MFLAATPQAAPMLLLLPPAPNFLAVVPMDIDAVLWRTTHLQTCYQCGQKGHLCCNCTLHHDTCYMTLEEKEDLIQQLMADIDAATGQQPEQGPGAAETSVEAAIEVPAEEVFVPCGR
jgi:hypothetical protein